MQWIRDGWRSVIGSTALSIVNAFFKDNKDYDFSTDESWQEYAAWILRGCGFLYADTDAGEPKVSV